jgi:hypothetical protein
MTLEKLQLIATTSATPQFKVRWLEFWNLGVYSRQAVHFLLKGFTDRDLESWLRFEILYQPCLVMVFEY